MDRATAVSIFPRLVEHGFEITSPADEAYNCIAWAVGDTLRRWWPIKFRDQQLGGVYWPTGNSTVDLWNFEEAFRSIGYEPCPNGDKEPGFEKIVLYVNRNGTPTHAARQAGDGTWLSKLGANVDIRHMDVNGVSGDSYGRPARYMRRQLGDSAEEPKTPTTSRVANMFAFKSRKRRTSRSR